MKNVAEIIDALGGNAKVANHLGVGHSVVSEFKRRNSIPVEPYWEKLIGMASNLGVPNINAETLMTSQSKRLSAREASQ